MTNRLLVGFLVDVVLLIAWGTTRGQEITKPKIPPRLNQVLHWLPPDTETLFVANGPFQLPSEWGDDRPFLESAQSFSFGLVTQLQMGLLREQLQGQPVLIGALASRRFTAPKGLGMMPSEGCQILQFADSAYGAVEAAMETCLAKAPKTMRLGETRVAVFTEKWEDDEWTLLVAQPVRGVLLCATDRRFLEQVLAHMKRKHKDRALPDNLPQWQHVNLEAPVWAIRHYRKDSADTDPSSPFRPRAWMPDAKAVGLVFWFDAKPDSMARVRYLTGAKDAVKIVRQQWGASETLPLTIKEIEPGVAEISMRTMENDGGGHLFLFAVLQSLGHGLFL